jgi:hypothetical protein
MQPRGFQSAAALPGLSPSLAGIAMRARSLQTVADGDPR